MSYCWLIIDVSIFPVRKFLLQGPFLYFIFYAMPNNTLQQDLGVTG